MTCLSHSYESSSTSVPVSQFVGDRPLSKECNRFSFGQLQLICVCLSVFYSLTNSILFCCLLVRWLTVSFVDLLMTCCFVTKRAFFPRLVCTGKPLLRLCEWAFGWLMNWLVGGEEDGWMDWMIDELIGWWVRGWVDGLDDWWTDWLVGKRMVGWIGWLMNWLVGG